jgi:CBS domain-containing protein
MIVASILKTKSSNEVATTTAERSIADASHLLHQRRIGALVVVDETGGIVGILSERDIVRGLAQKGEAVLSMMIRDLMTSNVLVCSPEDSLEHLMSMMTSNRIRHLPVVDNGKLAGIITIGDVVKSRLEETTMQVDSLREYVMAAH